MNKPDTKEAKVFKALENSKFTWRTVRGISTEVKLPTQDVHQIIVSQGERIVVSSVPNTSGETLYASRVVHRKKASHFNRFVAAIKNRGA